MNKEDSLYSIYVQILKEELVMAMGCTEPIAISYACAKATQVLDHLPDRIVVKASGSIIKNVKSVIVPHTNGLKGLKLQLLQELYMEMPTPNLKCFLGQHVNKLKNCLNMFKIQILPCNTLNKDMCSI